MVRTGCSTAAQKFAPSCLGPQWCWRSTLPMDHTHWQLEVESARMRADLFFLIEEALGISWTEQFTFQHPVRPIGPAAKVTPSYDPYENTQGGKGTLTALKDKDKMYHDVTDCLDVPWCFWLPWNRQGFKTIWRGWHPLTIFFWSNEMLRAEKWWIRMPPNCRLAV